MLHGWDTITIYQHWKVGHIRGAAQWLMAVRIRSGSVLFSEAIHSVDDNRKWLDKYKPVMPTIDWLISISLCPWVDRSASWEGWERCDASNLDVSERGGEDARRACLADDTPADRGTIPPHVCVMALCTVQWEVCPLLIQTHQKTSIPRFYYTSIIPACTSTKKHAAAKDSILPVQVLIYFSIFYFLCTFQQVDIYYMYSTWYTSMWT